MIDFHVHLGNLYRHSYPSKVGLSAHQLIERMNREGIEISVLLPLESPEGAGGYFLTKQAIEARDMYPERLIAFLCVDPRQSRVAEQIDVFVKHYGCKVEILKVSSVKNLTIVEILTLFVISLRRQTNPL